MTRFLDGEDDEDGSPNVEKAVCECDWRLIQATGNRHYIRIFYSSLHFSPRNYGLRLRICT